jgi:hypothetical protein
MLLRQVRPGGAEAAHDLTQLLAFKDEAQYGFGDVAGQKLFRALRRAESLIKFAGEVLAR